MTENIETRLISLEQWRTSVAVSIGKQEVDKDYINKKFDQIEAELKEIKSVARNLNYTIYAAVIAYVVKFAFSGELAATSLLS